MPMCQVARSNLANPLALAFRLKPAKDIARVLAQNRTDAYCARETLREACAAQPPVWQEELHYWCQRWDVPVLWDVPRQWEQHGKENRCR